ncbi:hypothetical protein L873DRAFT_1683045 [Choiromyces venosus 120613-1]|uniref:Uncharacterized protein n=1 Tax=Choiromyces venosus 120613-1 TaxID=1336337 RepID=A0A3N4JMN7_9PEZI|nr:hypothetical protein L873DRAFT_1683045 [Choiromyces venosus 120613-1]
MAHTTVASADDSDDIGARLSKLNLPQKPLIMEKVNNGSDLKQCRHPESDPCFCYEYLTLLDRPDYKDKWLPDSPEPETKLVKVNGSASAPGSGSLPSVNGTTKPFTAAKKFSLGQYKDRIAGKTPAKASAPATTSTPSTTSKSSPARTTVKKPVENHTPERQEVVVRSSKEVRGTPVREGPPPKKRQRTVTPPPLRPPPPPAITTPTLPSLPPLLSPTLPQAIEEALAQEDRDRDRDRSRAKRDEGYYQGSTTLKPRQRADSNASDKGKKPVASGKKLPGSASSTPRHTLQSPSKAVGNKTIPKSALGGNTTPKAVSAKTVSKRPASPRPSGSRLSSKYPTPSESGPSLVVKLKFSRRRIKDVASLLRLKPNPKRIRQDEDQHLSAPPAKRQKGSESLNSSATRSPAFKSPALKAPKERDMITPPKKLNGTATVKRSDSEGRVHTPAKGEKHGGRNGVASGVPKELTPAILAEVHGLRQEHSRFSEFGKQAKYEADRVFKSVDGAAVDRDKLRYATVVLTDSVLCFMISFSFEQEAKLLERRSPPAEMWKSIIPLCLFLGDKAIPYPSLFGLSKQLEAMIRQHIFDLEIVQYEKMVVPGTTSKAPTPDSGGNTASDQMKAYQAFKSALTKSSRELKDCWLVGTKELTYDDIQVKFPQTYALRSKKFINPTTVNVKNGRFKQPYQLPLHRNSTMLEAVNFGYNFLLEWVAGEGVKFQSRLTDIIREGRQRD